MAKELPENEREQIVTKIITDSLFYAKENIKQTDETTLVNLVRGLLSLRIYINDVCREARRNIDKELYFYPDTADIFFTTCGLWLSGYISDSDVPELTYWGEFIKAVCASVKITDASESMSFVLSDDDPQFYMNTDVIEKVLKIKVEDQ